MNYSMSFLIFFAFFFFITSGIIFVDSSTNVKRHYLQIKQDARDDDCKCKNKLSWRATDFNLEFIVPQAFEQFMKSQKLQKLKFYICYESLPIAKYKPQFNLRNVANNEVANVCDPQNFGKYHGFQIELGVDTRHDSLKGKLTTSFNSNEWHFELKDYLSSTTGDNTFNFQFSSEIVELLEQHGIRLRFLNSSNPVGSSPLGYLERSNQSLYNGVYLMRNEFPWVLAFDAALMAIDGEPIIEKLGNKKSQLTNTNYPLYYHFVIHQVQDGCEISKELTFTPTIRIECSHYNVRVKEKERNQTQCRSCQVDEPDEEKPIFKISHGIKVEDNTRWPWLVALVSYYEYQDSRGNPLGTFQSKCTGSIIDEYFVLTAAHCVDPDPILMWSDEDRKHLPAGTVKIVLLGIMLFAGQPFFKDPNAQIRFVSGLYMLNSYSAPIAFINDVPILFLYDDDIAMLQLIEPFDFNSRVGKIGLFNGDFGDMMYNKARVAGWGYTKDFDIYTKDLNEQIKQAKHEFHLHEAIGRINDTETCVNILTKNIETLTNPEERNSKFYKDAKNKYLDVIKKRICYSGLNSSSVQKGDSGGPLMVAGQPDGCCKLFGVASIIIYRFSAEVYPNPASYVNTTNFAEWIEGIMKIKDGKEEEEKFLESYGPYTKYVKL